jgi:hypothetical protein
VETTHSPVGAWDTPYDFEDQAEWVVPRRRVERYEPYPPSPDEAARPWRRATIAVTTVAALELIALVAVGVVYIGRPMAERKVQQTAATQTAAPVKAAASTARKTPFKPPRAHRTKPAAAILPRGRVPILVLNGNGITGAAANEAALVRARGYTVTDSLNAKRLDYGHSVVMYRPGLKREAARLARDLNISIVTPLDGLRIRDLSGAKLAVVVGKT